MITTNTQTCDKCKQTMPSSYVYRIQGYRCVLEGSQDADIQHSTLRRFKLCLSCYQTLMNKIEVTILRG